MRTTDMTSGRPARLILGFAWPLMLGNICQQLYTIVDAAFVGRFAGISALAAVGTADWFSWLVFGIVWGFTQGFSILISQRFGAADQQGLHAAVGQAITLTACLTALFTVAGQLLILPVMGILQTPLEIRPLAELYLRILFGGMPILAAYNIQASVLRAMGDSKTPLVAMTISSLTNIALDALFVIVFHWGVAGAAAATLIAQAASAVYCYSVVRTMRQLKLRRHDFSLSADGPRLLRLGSPTAVQNVIIGLGGLVVQRVINGFGALFIAGFTATNKLYGLIEMAAMSFGGALAAYAGQNFGAGKIGRIKTGVSCGAKMAVATALGIAGIMFLVGRPALSLFVDPGEALREQVLDIAQQYLHVMLIALFTLYLLYVYRSTLQGMGDTVTPMLSGLMELIMRSAAALSLPAILGQSGVFWAEPAAWAGAAVLLAATYYYKIHRISEREEP